MIDWVNDEIDILIGDVRAELITDEVIKSIIVNEVTLGTFEKIIKKFRIEEFNDSLHDLHRHHNYNNRSIYPKSHFPYQELPHIFVN